MISESTVRAIWNKLILTGNEENLPRALMVRQLALRDSRKIVRKRTYINMVTRKVNRKRRLTG